MCCRKKGKIKQKKRKIKRQKGKGVYSNRKRRQRGGIVAERDPWGRIVTNRHPWIVN